MSEAQKIIKYVAIAFAVSLIVSIFSGIYYLGGIVGHAVIDNEKEGINIEDYSNETTILNINISVSKLIIKEGPTFKVENNNDDINVKQDFNKLSIVEKVHLFKIFDKSEVTVYIPSEMIFDKVYISNGAGTINIEDLKTKDLTLELGAGKIEINNLKVDNSANIDSGAGEVIINNANINNLSLQAGVGKFTLNTVLKGKSNIEAGIGSLNINLLDSKENYKIYALKGLGSINIDNRDFSNESVYGNGNNEIDIEGGVGSININFDK